jgi:mannose-1-phosphate guanylyltransferase/mannose-1-phosphate guanylyltransferase/mannose-6-phosphate isomerase
MAGGSGTRLWPASNRQHPKQFLAMPGEKIKTFFNAALDRALNVTAPDGRIIIIAGNNHVPHVKKICSLYGKDALQKMLLIPEPAAKNTAPAIACAAIYTQRVAKNNRNMLVLTSDHIIESEKDFAEQAVKLSAYTKYSSLAVFGITPRYAETGYGYIETAGTGNDDTPVPVKSFHEKPGKETAQKYLEAGNFFWNSGMFAFSTDFIIGEFKKYSPEVLSAFEQLAAPGEKDYANYGGLSVLEKWPGLEEAYANTKSVAFDVAIAEKCRNVIMARAAFNWFDVGSWDEYARLSDVAPNNGAVKKEEPFAVQSASCFVDSDIPVALCGVDDLVVVIRAGGKNPVALITRKGQTQQIKDIVELIKSKGQDHLL